MRRRVGLAVLAVGLAAALRAETNAELQAQVKARERAFAKTMADRDHAAFQTFLADEAVFFGRAGATHGKAAVAADWKPLFEEPAAPFSWDPETVEVLASGTLAISSGPVSGRTAQARLVQLDLAAREGRAVAGRVRQGLSLDQGANVERERRARPQRGARDQPGPARRVATVASPFASVVTSAGARPRVRRAQREARERTALLEHADRDRVTGPEARRIGERHDLEAQADRLAPGLVGRIAHAHDRLGRARAGATRQIAIPGSAIHARRRSAYCQRGPTPIATSWPPIRQADVVRRSASIGCPRSGKASPLVSSMRSSERGSTCAVAASHVSCAARGQREECQRGDQRA